MGAGGGKALRHGEKVLTPTGFVNIEDVKIGDEIITPKNTIEKIENVWPQGFVDIYKVSFQDGRSVDCCGEHLWQYHEAGKGAIKTKVANTLDLLDIVRKENSKDRGARRRLPITPITNPLEFGIKNSLPVSPYVLGCILGDGHIAVGGMCYLTSMDKEIFDNVENAGYKLGKLQIKDLGKNKACTRSILGLSRTVKALSLGGTLSQTKFIPDIYKYSSIEDRFEIVRGLMDTDGYVCALGKVYFDTTSEELANGLTYILRSLGFTISLTTKIGSYKKDNKRVLCSKVYKLYIRGPNSYKLFKLSRKVIRCKNKIVGNRIVSIEPIGKDFATCISVTGEDKLFVTTNFIVTHNSYTCLTKNLDGIKDKHFRCTVFRRTYPELKRQGGLIDESKTIYTDFKGDYKSQAMVWQFPSGATVAFSAIASDDDLGSWQGSQLTRALIDEAADKWTEKQVLFLLSRLRSAHSKIHPQLILSCNPDINSFLKNWVDFCLDPETGVPVEGTENRIRWMVALDNKVYWADSPEECFELYGKPRGMIYAKGVTEAELENYSKEEKTRLFMPKSFRFIPTGVYDNPYLLPPRNNSYLSNLLSQPYVNQLKYLHGSWTAREQSAGFFKREWCEVVDFPPNVVTKRIRAWDFAASEASTSGGNPDYTAGVKMSRDRLGYYYIEDVIRFQARTDKVLKTVIEVAENDGIDECDVCIPEDPGASGKAAAAWYRKTMAEAGVGSKTIATVANKSKLTRFKPLCALAESGMLKIVKADWNDDFFFELENFSGDLKLQRMLKDDQVDAASDAFTNLCRSITIPTFSIPSFPAPSPVPKV